MPVIRPLARWIPLLSLILILAACGGEDGDGPVGPPPPPPDPLAVDDLRVIAGADGEVTLAWTSPGVAGKASYDLRYDLRHVPYGEEGVDWNLWTILEAPANDAQSGTARTHTVTGLVPGSVSVFALAVSADGETWTERSAPAVGTASPGHDTTPPAAVTTLALTGGTRNSLTVSWRTGGGDGPYGTAAGYEARYATGPIDAGNWDAATVIPGLAVDGLGLWTAAIEGLVEDTEYFVAVVASDEAGNTSPVSAAWSARTRDRNVTFVNVEGTGDEPTIYQALARAEAGDLILVGPGRYTWTNQGGNPLIAMIWTRALLDSVEVRSTHGPEATILDAERQAPVIHITGGAVDPPGGERYWTGITIDGFTLTGGLADGVEGGDEGPWAGAGINIHLSDTILRNCIVTGNEAVQGGGVWVGGLGDATVENCLIYGNDATFGGGLFLINSEPVITVRNCEIVDNHASRHGGGVLAARCSFVMEDCLIARNDANLAGGGVYIINIWHPDPTWNMVGGIHGATIADNDAPVGSGIYIEDTPNFDISRVIVAYNTGSAAIKSVKTRFGLRIGCTNLYGNLGGAQWPVGIDDQFGHIQADPRFCDRISYYLRADSPCLADCGVMGARGVGCGN